jgi:hypothetical protein
VATNAGAQASAPVVLHVRRPDTLAEAAQAKVKSGAGAAAK